MTLQALDLLNSNRNDAYEGALTALCDDTRESWEDVLARDPDELEEEEEPATADATARVPWANGSISKTPIGPFQKTVFALRASSA